MDWNNMSSSEKFWSVTVVAVVLIGMILAFQQDDCVVRVRNGYDNECVVYEGDY